MLGSFLSAWVIFPLALLVASVGCGLLVRRITAGSMSPLLVAPVGFALVVSICSFATSYHWLARAAGPIVAVVTLAGLVLEASALPARRPRLRFGPWVWPLLAAVVAFAAVGGPVFLTGSVGWTGYTRIVDIAFQMDFGQYLAEAGRAAPANGNSSFNTLVAKLLGIGYPGGGQATLGAMALLVRGNVAWCYQAFLAFATAMGAVAIYATLGRVTRNPLLRMVGAAVAIQPNILYGYTLEAGIKELTAAVLLMVVIAVFADCMPGEGPRRRAVALAVAVSGAFGAFSIGITPWLGLILAGMFVVSLVKRSGHWLVLQTWAVFALVAIAISWPGLVTAGKLATVAGSAIGGVVDLGLGNLAVPVSRWAAAGVYITSDYRYPLVHTTSTHAFDILIVALGVLGVIAAVVRRRWLIVVVGVSAPVALYYFIQHSTAWIQLKSFTITSAFAVLLAFVGVAALQTSRRRLFSWAGWLAAGAVAAGVLYGNAIVYHDTPLAPGARYHDLASISERYKGQGPMLDPYFDEYAEYFLRDEKATSIVNPANLNFQVRPGIPLPGGQSFGWDLNQLVPAYLQSFPLIIEPRSPTTSRAPSNYDLVEKTRYFEVWRRTRPSATVVEHLPLSNLPHERNARFCTDIERHLRAAGPGAQVAYSLTSTLAVLNPVESERPDYWKATGPSTVSLHGSGTLRATVRVPEGARYSIWLEGSIGRRLTIYLDGRRLGSLGYEERYPNQFLLVGYAQLHTGPHTLRIVRGNGDLHPGSGDPGETVGRTLGAIVFNREDASDNRVYVAPASHAAQVCAAPVGYEWMEVLKPSGAPANALPAPPRP